MCGLPCWLWLLALALTFPLAALVGRVLRIHDRPEDADP